MAQKAKRGPWQGPRSKHQHPKRPNTTIQRPSKQALKAAREHDAPLETPPHLIVQAISLVRRFALSDTRAKLLAELAWSVAK